MTRTSTELPRLEPESSASTNFAMAAGIISYLKWEFSVNLDFKGGFLYTKSMTFNRQNPYFAQIIDRYALTKPGSGKRTEHIVLDLQIRCNGRKRCFSFPQFTFKFLVRILLFQGYDLLQCQTNVCFSNHTLPPCLRQRSLELFKTVVESR